MQANSRKTFFKEKPAATYLYTFLLYSKVQSQNDQTLDKAILPKWSANLCMQNQALFDKIHDVMNGAGLSFPMFFGNLLFQIHSFLNQAFFGLAVLTKQRPTQILASLSIWQSPKSIRLMWYYKKQQLNAIFVNVEYVKVKGKTILRLQEMVLYLLLKIWTNQQIRTVFALVVVVSIIALLLLSYLFSASSHWHHYRLTRLLLFFSVVGTTASKWQCPFLLFLSCNTTPSQ